MYKGSYLLRCGVPSPFIGVKVSVLHLFATEHLTSFRFVNIVENFCQNTRDLPKVDNL